MTTVAQTQTRRNEGGRYSAKGASDWYKAIEAAHIARLEAEEDAARALATALATQVGNAVAALPEAGERLAKAASLVQHGEVWPLSSGNFLAGSQHNAREAYLVTRAGGWHCDCPDHQYRTATCKHILAAMLTVKLGTLYHATYSMPEAA